MPDQERLNLPSASSFASDVQCPGRRQLIASLNLPPEVPDEETQRGTRIHTAWMKESPLELQDDSENDDYQAGILHAKDLAWQWAETYGLIDELPREERLWLHDKGFNPIASGQLDRHWMTKDKKHLAVLDFKSGWSNYVPAANKSWQLRFYAVLGWKNYDVETVRVAFVKPKSKAEPVDYCDYTAADLEQSEQAILYHLWASKQEDAPRMAGPHCRYCPARAHCAEAGAYYLLPSVVSMKVAEEALDIGVRISMLAPKDLARIFEAGPVIDSILKAVKTRLKEMSDEDLSLLGLKLGKGRRLAPIVNVKGAYDRVRQEGLSEDQAWNLLFMSKGDLTKQLKLQFGWSDAQARGWISGQLKDFIEEKESEQILKKI